MNVPKLTILDESYPRTTATSRSDVPFRSLLVVGLIAGLIAAGCGVALRLQLLAVASKLEDRALTRAEAAFDRQLKSSGNDLMALVRVIVDDARVRTTLATPGIDDATIIDLLRDLKASTGVSVIGVLEAGRVRTCVGNDGLIGADLSASSLVREAWDNGRSSGLWALKDELLAVAMAPVRLASDPPRLLMLGGQVGGRALDVVGDLTGTAGALMINGRPVAGDEALALRTAGKGPGVHQLDTPDKTRFRIGSVPVVSLPVRSVWMIRNDESRGEILVGRWITVCGITSATVAALAALILLVLSRGRRMTFEV